MALIWAGPGSSKHLAISVDTYGIISRTINFDVINIVQFVIIVLPSNNYGLSSLYDRRWKGTIKCRALSGTSMLCLLRNLLRNCFILSAKHNQFPSTTCIPKSWSKTTTTKTMTTTLIITIAKTLTRTNLRGFFALSQYVGGLTKHGGLRRHGGLIATHERHPGAIYSKTSS